MSSSYIERSKAGIRDSYALGERARLGVAGLPDDRAGFERTLVNQGLATGWLDKALNGDYVTPGAQAAWCGWQGVAMPFGVEPVSS